MTALVYKKVPTSAEVYAVIRARHADEMAPFGTYTSERCAWTEWGIRGHDCPIVGVETTWSIRTDGRREEERSTYWLCSVVEPTE